MNADMFKDCGYTNFEGNTYQPDGVVWQSYRPLTIEDRLSGLEKDIREIKELLEWIKFRM